MAGTRQEPWLKIYPAYIPLQQKWAIVTDTSEKPKDMKGLPGAVFWGDLVASDIGTTKGEFRINAMKYGSGYSCLFENEKDCQRFFEDFVEPIWDAKQMAEMMIATGERW